MKHTERYTFTFGALVRGTASGAIRTALTGIDGVEFELTETRRGWTGSDYVLVVRSDSQPALQVIDKHIRAWMKQYEE